MKYLPYVVRLACCFAMGCATKSAGISLRMPQFWVIFFAFFIYGTVRGYQGK